MTPTQLFRYEERLDTRGVHVDIRVFNVVKETPCGYWIDLYNGLFEYDKHSRKWVSKTAKRRFAYPTEHEALTNFKARKRRQIEILQSRIHYAKVALRMADPEGEYQERSFSRWHMESL